MHICGLQKTTLIDYPGKIACTLFLHGCNFRCQYCYNADLVIHKPTGTFSEDEVLAFLLKRKNILEGVCITGGEPLLSLEKSFVKKIKQLGYAIKIDTNGTNPEKLKEFIDEGLVDYVAMDIKATKDDYNSITKAKVNLDLLEQSMQLTVSLPTYEFRTTVFSSFHTEDKINEMATWITQTTQTKPKHYFLQGFKNEGVFIDKASYSKPSTTQEHLNALKNSVKEYFETVEVRY